jgi:hypothetical protein
VAGDVKFVVLDIAQAEVGKYKTLLYIHVNRVNRKFYIGRTTMLAADRFNMGRGYRFQRALGSAIGHYGWQIFESFILALGDDDASLRELEVQAIREAGGHKSHNAIIRNCPGLLRVLGLPGWLPSHKHIASN